jgi:hypothetical protein
LARGCRMAKPVARESCSRGAPRVPTLVRLDFDRRAQDTADNGMQPPRTGPQIGDCTRDKATKNGAHRNDMASLRSSGRPATEGCGELRRQLPGDSSTRCTPRCNGGIPPSTSTSSCNLPRVRQPAPGAGRPQDADHQDRHGRDASACDAARPVVDLSKSLGNWSACGFRYALR